MRKATWVLVGLGAQRVVGVHACNTRGLHHGLGRRKNAILNQHGLDRGR